MIPDNNHIKALIFDMGNVVLNVDHMIACRKFAEFSSLSDEEIYKNIIGTSLEDSFERGEISSNTFYLSVLEKICADIPFEDFNMIFSDVFSLNNGMTEVISRIKEKAGIILLSNTNKLHFSWVEKKFDVLKEFKVRVLSYEVGIRKPEKEIFIFALEKLGFKPEEVLYIDDVKEYINSAKELGINGILFESADGLVTELKKYFPDFLSFGN